MTGPGQRHERDESRGHSKPGARASQTRRVLVDARPLQGADAERGIGTYVRGLLGGLAETGWGERVALVVDAARPVPPLPDAGFLAYAVHRRYPGRLAAYEDAFALRRDLGRIAPALYHATTLSLPAGAAVPWVATVHDLIPWAWRGAGMRGERVRFGLARRLLPRADRLIAVSEATARDLRRLTSAEPGSIAVVPEGVAPGFHPRAGARGRVRERWGIENPYLLHVGSLDRRKNPGALLAAWARARQECACDLVVAGRPGPQAPSRLEGARVLGQVAFEELADLYSAAGCLVFASAYEGFGLPILEALACGCPAVCFDNSSLPEVAGQVAEMVPDGDAQALGAAAVRFLVDGEARTRVLEAGPRWSGRFTWRRAAAATAEIYEALLR